MDRTLDLVAKLFGSKVRVLVLAALAEARGEALTATDIARRQGLSVQQAAKQLRLLEGIGLLRSEKRGRLKLYQVDESFPIWPELRRIMLKTLGIGGMIARAIGGLPVRVAFLFGSLASGEERLGSDVDLMVIGEVDARAVSDALKDVERELGREINPVVYRPEELRAAHEQGQPFIGSVMRGPKIFLVGDEDELRRIVAGAADTQTRSDATGE